MRLAVLTAPHIGVQWTLSIPSSPRVVSLTPIAAVEVVGPGVVGVGGGVGAGIGGWDLQLDAQETALK